MYSNTNHYYYYTEYLKISKSVLATSCEELTPWRSDAGRDWGQEEKGTTENEMTGWHHRLDGHEFG